MPPSNLQTSLQEQITSLNDRASDTTFETRPRIKGRVFLPDREKPRISFNNPTPRVKLKERINLTPDLEDKVQLEYVIPHPYDLSYACLMIPRFSSHYLIGDIAECLREWMRQICISFTWRLEYLTVHPDFIQWIVNVPPATPPSVCIRTIREHTSNKIFDDFPHFKQENFSKDFWAPGYFVLGGNRPHPREMINDYILLTRQQQGIQPHRSK